jgi:hypothetical protein
LLKVLLFVTFVSAAALGAIITHPAYIDAVLDTYFETETITHP